jgi:hypothetical protein
MRGLSDQFRLAGSPQDKWCRHPEHLAGQLEARLLGTTMPYCCAQRIVCCDKSASVKCLQLMARTALPGARSLQAPGSATG